MSASIYRLKTSLIAGIKRGSNYRLTQLSGGLVLPAEAKPDRNGMIEATYEGNIVLVFVRDLTTVPSVSASNRPRPRCL